MHSVPHAEHPAPREAGQSALRPSALRMSAARRLAIAAIPLVLLWTLVVLVTGIGS